MMNQGKGCGPVCIDKEPGTASSWVPAKIPVHHVLLSVRGQSTKTGADLCEHRTASTHQNNVKSQNYFTFHRNNLPYIHDDKRFRDRSVPFLPPLEMKILRTDLSTTCWVCDQYVRGVDTVQWLCVIRNGVRCSDSGCSSKQYPCHVVQGMEGEDGGHFGCRTLN